jgi:hypothetical protein
MPDSPALIEAPSEPLWRVERESPALRFSRINSVDAAQDRAGNRFDVPGAGVLYGATLAQGAFAETLAHFRPSATLLAKLKATGGPVPEVGIVPASWREDRLLRRFVFDKPLPFVDIESPVTHTYLATNAPELLAARGLSALDVSDVRGPSRLLPRSIAGWLYSRTDDHGSPLYAGIRYVSRLGDYECWAIFEGTAVRVTGEESIKASSHTLQEVATIYALTIQ